MCIVVNDRSQWKVESGFVRRSLDGESELGGEVFGDVDMKKDRCDLYFHILSHHSDVQLRPS